MLFFNVQLSILSFLIPQKTVMNLKIAKNVILQTLMYCIHLFRLICFPKDIPLVLLLSARLH